MSELGPSSGDVVPTDRLHFLQRTARSVAEIQPQVVSVDEVMVYLEVLGYNDRIAAMYGFEGLYDLARCVFEFTSFYDTKTPEEKAAGILVKSPFRRLAEGLGLSFAWLSSLLLLYATGISFWMGWKIPLPDMSAIIVGAFLGVVMTEGTIQSFSRLFLLDYNQLNISGAKITLERSYAAFLLILIPVLSLLFAAGAAASIPFQLVVISILSTASISWHRISYLSIYALEKVKLLVISYSAAVLVLFVFFNFGSAYVPDVVTRYFASLGAALVVLSISPFYLYYSIFVRKPKPSNASKAIHFFRQPRMSSDTLKSRFAVQVWEVLPYSLYGTFFFIMLFSDRVISWYYNPLKFAAGLPLLFNSVYHSGADTALLVLFPVLFVQYALLGSIHAELSNRTQDLKMAEMHMIQEFLRVKYTRLMAATLAVAISIAGILITLAPTFVTSLGGSTASVIVLRIAALSNILISMFVANAAFLSLLGRAKPLAIMAFVGAATVISGGIYFGSSAFQDTVFGYLAAASIVAIASTVYASLLMEHADDIYFSRFS